MTARHWALGLSLTLLALPALAEQARGRGSSGGRDRNAVGARHHAGASDRAVARGGTSVRSGSPVRAGSAELRHPRAGTGHGFRDGAGYYRYGYRGNYYYPSYYRTYGGLGYWDWPYWSSWGYWGYPYWGGSYYPGFYSSGAYYGGGGYYGGYPGYSYYGDTGSLRLLVDPSETRVFVDGYYSGVVDDYDGLFQRLHLSRGRHEIVFKLDGYQTYHVKVYVTPDHTLKIKHEMIRGSGEAVEDLTGGYPEAEAPSAAYREPRAESDLERDERAPDRSYEREASSPGRLRFDVRPDDASIYVDGEFRGPARRLRELQLPAGKHMIEIVRPGYRTFAREVEVRPGRTEELGVDLERS